MKVASYYGCLLVRPREVTGFDDPENPTSLDRLVTAMGGDEPGMAPQGGLLRRRA